MESKLYKEFQDMRSNGIKVKEWWFRQTAKKLHLNVAFKMSNRWFQAFKARYNISLRRSTHTAQKSSEEFRVIVQLFHRYLRRTASPEVEKLKDKQTGLLGLWELSDIANMDETPLEFCFNTKGATYADTGEKTVWCRTTGSGQDKRQCTVQLTIFADGVPLCKVFNYIQRYWTENHSQGTKTI